MRGQRQVGSPSRQHAALARVVEVAATKVWLDALVVVGSLADGSADALSDVDLLVVVRDGEFAHAWRERADLHGGIALHAWDQQTQGREDVAAHRWLTGDVVLVEALFTTASSGVRLAEPWQLVAGSHTAAQRLPSRPPIDRGEMTAVGADPVEAAYDELKSRLRGAASASP